MKLGIAIAAVFVIYVLCNVVAFVYDNVNERYAAAEAVGYEAVEYDASEYIHKEAVLELVRATVGMMQAHGYTLDPNAANEDRIQFLKKENQQ